jgi:hypothetical protein
LQGDGNLLPRDSLAEIMAAEEVIAAKSKMQAATLQHRANSLESGQSHNRHKGKT